MEEWIMIISQVGFPISVCIYGAFRLEKIITRNTDTTTKLTESITANTSMLQQMRDDCRK